LNIDIRRASSRAVIFVIAVVVAACAGTPPPVVTPSGEAQYLIDPRTGFTQPVPPAVDRKFDTAWRYFLAGNYDESARRLDDLQSRNPEYVPAALAKAAIAIANHNYDGAATIVSAADAKVPGYTAAKVYEAEIAAGQHNTQRAYDLYNELAQQPGAPPTVAVRLNSLRDQLFNELVARAQSTPAAEATALLRQALTVNSGSIDARVQLANQLIAQRSFDEALQALTPVTGTPDESRPDVQAALAEIEIGRGDYQSAMNRYDRLARTTHDARYTQRLNDIKELWNEANMPPQYQKALESPAIDRSDFAVLLYWKVTAVRFAQNVGSPPIAIDIEDAPGRDEIIRAMALGLYEIDPATRRISPNHPVNAAALARLGARVLTIAGASCARGVPAQNALAACGITDPSLNVPPDSAVTGKTAAAMLDQIEAASPH
jgi:thioredoxin-like negative regulator of GroEL